MFQKIEDQPRSSDGSFRNEWADVAFKSLVYAIIKINCMSAQAMAHEVWREWWGHDNPLADVIKFRFAQELGLRPRDQE